MVFRQCFDCENNCTQIIPWHQMANKHVLMAALTYNLHKYLRFLTQERKTAAHAMKISAKSLKKGVKTLLLSLFILTGTIPPEIERVNG